MSTYFEKFAGGFIDHLRKVAVDLTQPPASTTPANITAVKQTAPSKPMSGTIPKYTKVNSDVLETSITKHQPLAEPPPVRR